MFYLLLEGCVCLFVFLLFLTMKGFFSVVCYSAYYKILVYNNSFALVLYGTLIIRINM